MKSHQVIIFIFIQIAVDVFCLTDNVLALSCPFDSYLIIDGVCHDATKQPDNLTLEPKKRVYRYSSPPDIEDPRYRLLTTKKCSDFNDQETAQSYFDYYPENQDLDKDRDGYACNDLPRTSGDLLTRQIWDDLIYENKQKKLATDNKYSLSYEEVVDIIGFYPNAYVGNRNIWEDPINHKKIEIRFHQDMVADMKGIGFW